MINVCTSRLLSATTNMVEWLNISTRTQSFSPQADLVLKTFVWYLYSTCGGIKKKKIKYQKHYPPSNILAKRVNFTFMYHMAHFFWPWLMNDQHSSSTLLYHCGYVSDPIHLNMGLTSNKYVHVLHGNTRVPIIAKFNCFCAGQSQYKRMYIYRIYRKYPHNCRVPNNHRVPFKCWVHVCMLTNNHQFQMKAGSNFFFFFAKEEDITTRPIFFLVFLTLSCFFSLKRHQCEMEARPGYRAAKNEKLQREF